MASTPPNTALQQRNMRETLIYQARLAEQYGTVTVGGVEVVNIPELVRLAKISCGEIRTRIVNGEVEIQQGETPDHQLLSMEHERNESERTNQ